MKTLRRAMVTAGIGVLVICAGSAFGQFVKPLSNYSWRYFRPGNTGIMGDFCEAIGVDAEGQPWIGGYDPGFEEGGIARFDSQTRSWLNVSNVDFPEIGHPESTGTTRVSEIVRSPSGAFWMGTGRGLLYFDPLIGPSSLKRYDGNNSGAPGGWTTNVEIAPDGSIWATAYSTVWGNGGVTRFVPSTGVWTTYDGLGGDDIAVQPKPGGGYYVWAMDGDTVRASRFDSQTQTWQTYENLTGAPFKILGKGSVDEAGNVWMYRLTTDDFFNPVIDVRRPDGTWVGQSLPPGVSTTNFGCIRAYGNGKAIYADGSRGVYRFDGTTWTYLGVWGVGVWTDDLNIDGGGNIWASGDGGASRWDAQTGQWQRYRVTNTSQYDTFSNDLTLTRFGDGVFACANAAPGVGGMVQFDGVKWTGFNNLHYGIGVDWPFNTDNSSKVYVRPSNGQLLVVPMFDSLYRYTGGGWVDLQTPGTPKDLIEDSLNRLWMVNESGIYLYNGVSWSQVSDMGGTVLRKDPRLRGTVWVKGDFSIQRTDGVSIWRRDITDFPELDPQSDQFKGMVIDVNGMLWVSANTINLPENGGLYKINPQTGKYKVWTPGSWPFPGEYLMPLAATPDGRIWMQYDSDFLTAQRGLVSFDVKGKTKVFPAPSGGEPQWGGLPHAAIFDMEVRPIRQGYELWMSCGSRGIAVLTVK